MTDFIVHRSQHAYVLLAFIDTEFTHIIGINLIIWTVLSNSGKDKDIERELNTFNYTHETIR